MKPTRLVCDALEMKTIMIRNGFPNHPYLLAWSEFESALVAGLFECNLDATILKRHALLLQSQVTIAEDVLKLNTLSIIHFLP